MTAPVAAQVRAVQVHRRFGLGTVENQEGGERAVVNPRRHGVGQRLEMLAIQADAVGQVAVRNVGRCRKGALHDEIVGEVHGAPS